MKMQFPLRLTVVFIFSIFMPHFSSAQTTSCRSILNKAETAYTNGNLDDALQLLQDAETCDYKNVLQKEKQKLQKKIFTGIKDLKDAADASANLAKQKEQEIRRALENLQTEKGVRMSCESQEKYIRSANQSINTVRLFETEYNNLLARLKDKKLTLDSLEKIYLKNAELRNRSIPSLYQLMAVYGKSLNYDKAIELINEILEKYPELNIVISDRAYYYYQKKNYDKAIEDYNFLLERGLDSFNFLISRGLAYNHSYHFEKAENDFTAAIELNEVMDDPFLWKGQAYFHRGQVYESTSQWEKAKKDFDAALLIDSTDYLSLIRRGQVSYYLNEDKIGLAYINKGLIYAPYSSIGYTARAAFFQKQGQYQLALDDCNRAIKLDPESHSSYRSKASTFELLSKYDSALISINQAIELSPIENAGLFSQRASIFLNLNQPEKAASDMNKAISLSPKNSSVYHSKAFFHKKKNELDSALYFLNLAIKLEPNNFTGYFLRGGINYSKQDWNSALIDFNKSIELSPFASSYTNRADVWVQLNQPDSAISDMNHAILLDSMNFDIWLSRGRILRMLGKSKDAIHDHTKSLFLKPDYVWAFIGRANCYFDLNELELAKNDIDSAIILNPEIIVSYYVRSKIYFNFNDFEKLIPDATTFLKEYPDNADCLYWRSVAYRKTKRYDEAISDFNKLIKIPEEAPYAYAQRGEVYRNMKKFDLARLDLEKSKELNPDWGPVYVYIALLEADLKNMEAFYNCLQLAISSPQPYALRKRLEEGNEPTLMKYQKEPRFQEILKMSKE